MNYSIKEILVSTGLPIIQAAVGDQYAVCLIVDTGATHSMIDQGVAAYLLERGLIESSNEMRSVMGIDGQAEQAGTICLTFLFENQTYSHQFVLKSLKDAFCSLEIEHKIGVIGILGTDFLMKHKWVIDLDKLEINA